MGLLTEYIWATKIMQQIQRYAQYFTARRQLLSVHWTKGNYLPQRYSIVHIIVSKIVTTEQTTKREHKNLTFKGTCPRQSPPFKKNQLFIKIIFLYCHPFLSTGSKEIFIKKGEKVEFFFFRPLKELRGGELGYMFLRSFFYCRPPSGLTSTRK